MSDGFLLKRINEAGGWGRWIRQVNDTGGWYWGRWVMMRQMNDDEAVEWWWDRWGLNQLRLSTSNEWGVYISFKKSATWSARWDGWNCSQKTDFAESCCFHSTAWSKHPSALSEWMIEWRRSAEFSAVYLDYDRKSDEGKVLSSFLLRLASVSVIEGGVNVFGAGTNVFQQVSFYNFSKRKWKRKWKELIHTYPFPPPPLNTHILLLSSFQYTSSSFPPFHDAMPWSRMNDHGQVRFRFPFRFRWV